MSGKLLVTGASGHLGGRVLAHLLNTHNIPAEQIIATTRNPASLAELAAQGVDVRAASFDNPASLIAAFSGAERMLLISTDALDEPGKRLRQHQAAVAAAKEAGVQHITYTSMPQPDDSLVTFAPDHLGTEQALEASGLQWTILRDSWYMDNLYMTLPSVLATGQWYTSSGEGRIANVSREDCARAAAAVLAGAGESGKRYNLTGPELLTTAQIAALLSEELGKAIEVVHLDDESLTQGMIAAGVPAPVAPVFVSFDANTREGKIAVQTDDVKTLTGKAPQNYREFIRQHRDSLLALAA